jgi:hypothetical protein
MLVLLPVTFPRTLQLIRRLHMVNSERGRGEPVRGSVRRH